MNGAIDLAIEGIGLCAPGLADWQSGREVLAAAEFTHDSLEQNLRSAAGSLGISSP